MENLLEGAYDLHIHCGPDVVPRSVSGLDMAYRASRAGMRGFAIKAHYDCTCQQAAVVGQLVPGCNVLGTLTMNAQTGGPNPFAVEIAARLGARIIWCPTFDSASQRNYYLANLPHYIAPQEKLIGQQISVPSYCLTDESGRLTDEMSDVLDLVKEYDIVLATGHITHRETFALAAESRRRGFKKLLVTHADWSFTHYSVAEQKELVGLGAMIEHTYTSPAVLGAVGWDEVFREIREITPRHVVMSTDLGQANNIFPDEGLKDYAEHILAAGFGRDDLRLMISVNPAELVEK